MAAILESPHRVLPLIEELCKALHEEGVVYCHWKSNAALDRSARGDNDLDLLVSRAHKRLFTNILGRFGFKEVRPSAGQEFPGVLSYYGYDLEADSFVHVHTHYQLVVGHDMTKNYCLPIDKPFLRAAIQENLFRIAAPEFELIVFVIRMVLKHSTWDAILGRQGSLSTTERQELEYLQARVNPTQMYDVLKQHLPYVDATLFDNCIQSLRQDCPIWRRIKVGQQLQNRLKAQSRRSLISDICLKLWRRGIRVIRWHMFGHSPRKRMASGGAIIALVGGDGAGKSTATGNLYTWLSKDFGTVRIHMGRPPWAWTTYVIRGALKIARLFTEFGDSRSSLSVGAPANPPELPDYSQLLRCVCLARDRYRAYVKARRFSTNGGIAVCDRFPVVEIELMDSPQVERLVDGGKNNRLIRFLVRLEKNWYSSLGYPDVLIVLTVDPEIAVARKTDEDAASVRTRATEMWQLDWQTTRAHVIDANQPAADVLAELKSFVWSQI